METYVHTPVIKIKNEALNLIFLSHFHILWIPQGLWNHLTMLGYIISSTFFFNMN